MILRKFNFGFERIRLVYNRFMMYAVERPWKIVLIAVATLGFNLLLIPFVGTELQPVYDSGEFRVNLKAPPGVGLPDGGMVQAIGRNDSGRAGSPRFFYVAGRHKNACQ